MGGGGGEYFISYLCSICIYICNCKNVLVTLVAQMVGGWGETSNKWRPHHNPPHTNTLNNDVIFGLYQITVDGKPSLKITEFRVSQNPVSF